MSDKQQIQNDYIEYKLFPRILKLCYFFSLVKSHNRKNLFGKQLQSRWKADTTSYDFEKIRTPTLLNILNFNLIIS